MRRKMPPYMSLSKVIGVCGGGAIYLLTWDSVQKMSNTRYWRLLALLWAANMFWLSTEKFSGNLSGSLLARMLELLQINMADGTFSILHTVLRKLAHLFEYGVLSFLLYRSFGRDDRVSWRPSLARWCIVATASFSLTDEWHQSFVAGRYASLMDCGVDAMGAAIAMLLIYGSTRGLRTTIRQRAAG